MNGVDYLQQVIPHAAVHEAILANPQKRVPGQTGFGLGPLSKELAPFLAQLTAVVSEIFGRKMFLRLDRSSYRVQEPRGQGALSLHQDYDALTVMRKRRFKYIRIGNVWWGNALYSLPSLWRPMEYVCLPTPETACTVWAPLVTMDKYTPSLEVCPRLPPGRVPMKADAAGYSIVIDDAGYKGWPTFAITQMPAGDALMMSPLTLHRTWCTPWHTQTRHSVDLRFFSKP